MNIPTMSVAVFLSARHLSAKIRKEAFKIGEHLGRDGWSVMYGGGYPGLMGTLAKGVESEDGYITGVTTYHLANTEGAGYDPETTVLVESMSDRKMYELKSVSHVLILTGGFGTMDELFETVTLNQLGLLDTHIGVYAPEIATEMKALFKAMLKAKTINKKDLKRIQFFDSISEVFDFYSRKRFFRGV